MTVALAGALCAGNGATLRLRERDAAAEASLLNRLAQDLLQVTPQVSIDGDDALLLEIGGCLRLFRGLDALLSRVTALCTAQDVTATLALAHTPGAARLFAVHALDTRPLYDDAGHADIPGLRQALAALPVQGLELDPRTEESVMQMGLTTFADIEALPRQALGRRFGKTFTQWLDRLTGVAPDPRMAIAPETFFVRELNFLDGIVHADGLLFPMQRLLGEFSRFLRHRQLATQHLVWRITHSDGSTQEIAINTARPELSPARLLALSRIRLEGVQLPAPAETLRLACRQFIPLADSDAVTNLFGAAGNEDNRDDGIAALIDRLRARLGDRHCRQLAYHDGWRPEAAQRVVSAGAGTAVHPALPPLLPSHLARRPLWLLREPLRVLRQGERLHWRGTLTLLDGPERIDADWWSTPLARDYFVASHDDGVLYWVYHDLLQDDWYVHGVFG